MNIPKSISISIDLTKIDKSYIVKGKNGGQYLDLRLVNTPTNQYGSDYMVTQALPKSVRDEVKAAGGDYPKTPILGNGSAWQCMEGVLNSNKSGGAESTTPESSSSSNQDDDLPF